MLRLNENVAHGRLFHQFARVHHGHPVRHPVDHPEAVTDEENGRVQLALQFADEIQDLRLHGYVEACGRFIHDEERGVGQERHRNQHPLLLAAGQLRAWGGRA